MIPSTSILRRATSSLRHRGILWGVYTMNLPVHIELDFHESEYQEAGQSPLRALVSSQNTM